MATNKELIENIYGCFAVGDVPAVLGAMADDVRWTEADGFPLAGTFVGPQAVLEGVFMRLGEIGDHYSVVPEQYVVDGDTVYVGGHGPTDGTTVVTGKVGAGMSLAEAQRAARLTGLSILATLEAELEGSPPPRVVDVRLPSEWEAGHIPGSTNLPLQKLEAGLAALRRGGLHRTGVEDPLLRRERHADGDPARRRARGGAGAPHRGGLHGPTRAPEGVHRPRLPWRRVRRRRSARRVQAGGERGGMPRASRLILL